MPFEKFYDHSVGDIDVLEEESAEELDLEAAHSEADRLLERQREAEEKRLADLADTKEQEDQEELDRLYGDKDVMADIFPHNRNLRGDR